MSTYFEAYDKDVKIDKSGEQNRVQEQIYSYMATAFSTKVYGLV